jgi:hypothetical protein
MSPRFRIFTAHSRASAKRGLSSLDQTRVLCRDIREKIHAARRRKPARDMQPLFSQRPFSPKALSPGIRPAAGGAG